MKRLLAASVLTGLCLSAVPFRAQGNAAQADALQDRSTIVQDDEVITSGAILLVGGGGTPPDALIEALALTAAESPKVVVIPQASDLPDRGKGAVEMWREQGVQATLLDPLERPDANTLLEECDLIWISGGSQRDLLRRLAKHQFVSKIARLNSQGTIVGGTSAGAAAMGAVMLSGDPDPRALVAGAAVPYRGLALWPSAIIDQHFIERDRYGRLMTAVLSKPRMIGVGIAERTAVLVEGDNLRVMGEGQVVVFDARKATTKRVPPGELQSARGVKMHVFAPGDSWTWYE